MEAMWAMMQNQNQQMSQMMESQNRAAEMHNQLLTQIREVGGKGGGGCGKGGEGRKNHEDRLNGKAMTAVDRFKGGEAEWVDWKFKFLNAVGTGSKAMIRMLMWVEENVTKEETLTAATAVEKYKTACTTIRLLEHLTESKG